MTWLLILAAVVAVAGLAFGAYRAAQNPLFYAGLIKAVWNAVAPALLKRKSAEEEAADHERVRQGLPPKQKWHAGEH